MKDNYTDFVRETTFKGTVHHRENTGSHLGWYEETKEYFPNIYAKDMWLDYEYIPDTPEVDEYSVKIGEEEVKIYQKYEKLQLEPTSDKNVFYNENFKHIIDKYGYFVSLYDAEGNEIPFGYKKWSYDGNNGLLTFIDGIPKDILLPLSVTFYKYEGRMVDKGVLRRDGGVKMHEDYMPTKEDENAIANVKYVNSRVSNADELVKKLLPPEPPTLENKELIFLSSEEPFTANRVLDGKNESQVVFDNTDVIIKTPRIHNPEEGTLQLYISGNNFGIQPPTILLSDPQDQGDFKVFFNDDYYLDDLNSTGFYKGIEVGFAGTLFSKYITKENPVLEFQIVETTKKGIFKSQKYIIGKEQVPETSALDMDKELTIQNDIEFSWKNISGVSTPTAGSKLLYSNLFTNTLKNYFIPGQPIVSGKFFGNECEDGKFIIYPNISGYGTISAAPINILGTVEIPNNFYSENLNIDINSYNIFNEINGTWNRNYPIRIDTISDESQRVYSFKTDTKNELEAWDSNDSILDLKELQLLGGKWVWPSLDFSKMGEVNPFLVWKNDWLIKDTLRPNFKLKTAYDIRYVTLQYELSYANGVYLTIEGLKKLPKTNIYDLASLELKVIDDNEGDLGWFNGLKVYDGIGQVKAQEGCFIPYKSEKEKSYFTFGHKPRKGKLYIRIGIHTNNQKTKFLTPIVEENI